MSSGRLKFPIPKSRSVSDGIGILPMPEHGLPQAELSFCIWRGRDEVPSVDSGVVRFLWTEPAPRPLALPGSIPKRDVRVLDDGQVSVEFDTLGRVDSVEATCYHPGPRWVPEALALHREIVSKGESPLIMSAIATMMRYWPIFDAKWKRMAKSAAPVSPSSVATVRDSRSWEARTRADAMQDVW